MLSMPLKRLPPPPGFLLGETHCGSVVLGDNPMGDIPPADYPPSWIGSGVRVSASFYIFSGVIPPGEISPGGYLV